MAWVRLDEEFPDHPKVVTAGPLAGWLHVCALAYCNRYLTDGFVTYSQVRRLADFDGILRVEDANEWDEAVNDCPQIDPYALAATLVEVGIWERRQGGFLLHDFLDYQPSRAEIHAQRKAKSDAGRIGGKHSGRTRRSRTEAEPKQNTKQTGSRTEAEHQANDNHDSVPGSDSALSSSSANLNGTGATNPEEDEDSSKVAKTGRESKQKRSKREAQGEANGQAKPKPDPDPDPDTQRVKFAADKPPTSERRTRAPAEFPVDDLLRAWANTTTPGLTDLEHQTQRFLDYHRAKGSLMADWRAAWRTWMVRAVEYQAKPANGARPNAIDEFFAEAERRGVR